MKNIITKLYNEKISEEKIPETYEKKRYKNITIVKISEEERVVIFDYNVCVYWNMLNERIKKFEEEIECSVLERTIEKYKYELVLQENFYVQNDIFYINEMSISQDLFLISISNAIAQDLKVSQFENEIDEVINENKKIPIQLAKSGKINYTKKEISKKIGEIFLVSSKINLNYDLLDMPEFFWEYPRYEESYKKVFQYLDQEARIETLNKKVSVIQDMLSMLKEEQNHKHSSFLEWIIIILIGVEIGLTLSERI